MNPFQLIYDEATTYYLEALFAFLIMIGFYLIKPLIGINKKSPLTIQNQETLESSLDIDNISECSDESD